MINGLNPRLKEKVAIFATERDRVTAFCKTRRKVCNFGFVENKNRNRLFRGN
jgi:hypothetical protein